MVLQSQSACASKRIVSRAARCGRENGEVELRCDYSPELFAVRADLLCYERTLCLKVANLCVFFRLAHSAASVGHPQKYRRRACTPTAW